MGVILTGSTRRTREEEEGGEGREGGREGGRANEPALLLADTINKDLESVIGADDESVKVALLVHLDSGHA